MLGAGDTARGFPNVGCDTALQINLRFER